MSFPLFESPAAPTGVTNTAAQQHHSTAAAPAAAITQHRFLNLSGNFMLQFYLTLLI